MNFERSEEQYIFTIIMAVYNVEEYLEEAIQSVINQTLDFGKHVQLILVNDGSPDMSEHLCLRYSEEYPNNIFYISKENGGVSSARNEGLKYAEGKYINFLDPDDKLSLTTLEEVFKFFELHYDEVDVVSIPITFFEATTGPHPLNYKFAKARVVDLNEDYNHIQLSAASSFFKGTCFETNKFNIEISMGEDLDLLSRIIIQKLTLGVVPSGQYYYRKRNNGTSAIQLSSHNKDWYSGSIDKLYKSIINYSESQLGYVHKYIQYIVMYEIQWRLKIKDVRDILDGREQNIFLSKLREIMNYIEDSIIFEQKYLSMHLKLFALTFKREATASFKKVFFKDNVALYYKDKLIDSLKEQQIYLEFIKYTEQNITIEGFFGSFFDKSDFEILVKVNGEYFNVSEVDRKIHGVYSLGQLVKDYKGFITKIPVEDKESLEVQFYVRIEEHTIPIQIQFRRFTRLDSGINKSLLQKGVVLTHNNQKLIIRKSSKIGSKISNEFNRYKYMKKIKGINSKKILFARLCAHVLKILLNKKVWLFMDRIDKADDNAEHLYAFSLSQKDPIKKYFIIKRDSNDYERIKKYGKPVPAGSFKHKLLHLLSDKVISSHADEWVTNPFFGTEKFYIDFSTYP